jgi:fructan beta-fructosidase
MRLHFFFDRASCELFADGGRSVMTEVFFPNEPFSGWQFYVDHGSVKIISGQVYGLRSIWTGTQK